MRYYHEIPKKTNPKKGQRVYIRPHRGCLRTGSSAKCVGCFVYESVELVCKIGKIGFDNASSANVLRAENFYQTAINAELGIEALCCELLSKFVFLLNDKTALGIESEELML